MDITSINNLLNSLTPLGKKRAAKTAKKKATVRTFLCKLTIRAAKERA